MAWERDLTQRLAGKVAFLTAAGQGIGRATALEMARQGAGAVMISDVQDESGEETAELVAAWRQTRGYVVAVSDEVGLGVVPATPSGRLFRDELGRLNQALAAESEETELIVAGRALPLPAY